MKYSINLLLIFFISTLASCKSNSFSGFYENEYSHKLEIKDSIFKITTYDGMQGEYHCNGVIKTKGDTIIFLQNTKELQQNILNIYKCDSMVLIEKNHRKLYNKEYLFKRKRLRNKHKTQVDN